MKREFSRFLFRETVLGAPSVTRLIRVRDARRRGPMRVAHTDHLDVQASGQVTE